MKLYSKKRKKDLQNVHKIDLFELTLQIVDVNIVFYTRDIKGVKDIISGFFWF